MRVIHIAEFCRVRLWVGGQREPQVTSQRSGLEWQEIMRHLQLHLRFARRKNDLARFLHLSFSNMNLNMHQ